MTVVPAEDLKSITAGRNGEYIPLSFYEVDNAPQLIEKVEHTVRETGEWEVDFAGSFSRTKDDERIDCHSADFSIADVFHSLRAV